MDVHWLNANVGSVSEKVKNKIDHAASVCNLMIKTIQRLAFSISPEMLASIGLNATMEFFCKEFSILNRLVCDYTSDYDDNSISQEIKIDFFRICQDSLVELLNHKEAGEIRISISEIDNHIELSILDSGNGFSISLDKQVNALKSIQISANSINGVVALLNNTDKGMRLSVKLEKQTS